MWHLLSFCFVATLVTPLSLQILVKTLFGLIKLTLHYFPIFFTFLANRLTLSLVQVQQRSALSLGCCKSAEPYGLGRLWRCCFGCGSRVALLGEQFYTYTVKSKYYNTNKEVNIWCHKKRHEAFGNNKRNTLKVQKT